MPSISCSPTPLRAGGGGDVEFLQEQPVGQARAREVGVQDREADQRRRHRPPPGRACRPRSGTRRPRRRNPAAPRRRSAVHGPPAGRRGPLRRRGASCLICMAVRLTSLAGRGKGRQNPCNGSEAMKGVVNIEDLRKLAKKRLPKIAYDFIEGGTDDEVGPAHQRAGVPPGTHRAALPGRRDACATSRRRCSAGPIPARSASRRPASPACSAAAPT